MKSHEVERWTLQIIDQVKARRPVEDSRVELKAKWVDPEKAARRLAAHANAAGEEFLLWIIGVDERSGVVGAEVNELAVWWPRVQSCFDGIAPALVKNINVPVDDEMMISLIFATARVPFVIKNSAFGTEKCPVELEVPWREGNATRSARRADLLRLLSPLEKTPHLEVRTASLVVVPEKELGPFGEPVPSEAPRAFDWCFSAQTYTNCLNKGHGRSG